MEKDGSDARYAFVFDDIPKDEAEREYPELKDMFTTAPLGNAGDGWLDEHHVRVAEYYRVHAKKDKLLHIVDKTSGSEQIIRKSKLPKELLDLMPEGAIQNERDIESPEVEWYKIVGNKIADRRILLGRYIPISRAVGDETIIEGELDRKGHTRALKDPQRMYNYQASANVEYGALQTKAPWVAPAAAIEGLETYWETANTKNHSILPYNHKDEEGNDLTAPERAAPPAQAESFMKGMEIAAQDMMMVSGQYQADFGQPSNEKSGKAIQERQRQGDNATYHFIDGLAIMIRHLGKILIDLIPKIYDTPRTLRILAEDGTDSLVMLDPQAKQAYAEQKAHEKAQVQRIFNPNVGKYEVEADIGPAYATRRQEAWNAFEQIAANNKELMALIGDIMFQQADFPGAEKIAERMHNMLPPQALGQGMPPMVANLQAHLQQSQKAIEELIIQLAEAKLNATRAKDDGEAKKYNAITERLEILLDRIPSQKDIATMVHDLMVQEHQSSLDMAQTDQEHGNALELQASAPEPAGASA